MNSDREHMEAAIAQARACQAKGAEDTLRPHPNVGVLVVQEGRVLVAAFRGELNPGDHAEFIATEARLSQEPLAGATVYTTLEPCTTRRHPRIACADRLALRKIREVVIGMLDPNPVITGRGVLLLRDKGIRVRLFDPDLMDRVEELNRDFQRQFRPLQVLSAKVLEERSLDEWYQVINSIYSRNFTRDTESIFSHLVEIVGGLGTVAAEKVPPRVKLEDHIPKALAWWMALCGKVGVRSLQDMLWAKFPGVCPYCLERPHREVRCKQGRRRAIEEKRSPVDWDQIQKIRLNNALPRPRTLYQWQRLFAEIYEPRDGEDYGHTIAKLAEELGELAEALRALRITASYFLNEAADVFAWLMHLQTVLETKSVVAPEKLGLRLAESFAAAYPDRCSHCQNQICVCPPILGSTLGRIGHERRVEANEMMSSQDTLRMFGLRVD